MQDLEVINRQNAQASRQVISQEVERNAAPGNRTELHNPGPAAI